MATAAADSAHTGLQARPAVQDWLGDGLRSLLFHAGWLVQAHLGMALSWSWAGGLGGVALWWACLALLGRRSQPAPSRSRVTGTSALAAAGLAVAMTQGGAWAMLGWGLNLLSWAWLCSRYSAMTEVGRVPRLGQALAWLAGMWLAALLAAGMRWPSAWPLLCVMFLALPWLRPKPQGEHPVHALNLPMGLMMGSLLPMAQWCGSQGWSAVESVVLHLTAMALGLYLAAAFRPRGATAVRGAWALAALLCLLDSPWAMLVSAAVVAAASGWSRRLTGWHQVLIGPTLLLAVGQLSPTWGPEALRLVLVGVLVLGVWAIREERTRAPWL